MKSEKILSIANWGVKIDGAESKYSSAIIAHVGTRNQAYIGQSFDLLDNYTDYWPTPYIKNVVAALPPNNDESTGALPIANNTLAKQRVGLPYCSFEIEISNNLNTVAKCELYVLLSKRDHELDVSNSIIATDQDYGMGAPEMREANAGTASTDNIYGFPTHTTLGTKLGDWPIIRRNFKFLKVIKFNLPPTSNQTHVFNINYNKIFDQIVDDQGSHYNFIKNKSLTFYWRAKGEIVKDDTVDAGTGVIATSPTSVSFQISARKYFQAAQDTINPPLKLAATALPTGAATNKISAVTQGEAAALLDVLFD